MTASAKSLRLSGAWCVLAMAAGVLSTVPLLLASDWIALAALSLWPWHDSLARAFVNAAVPEETSKLFFLLVWLCCYTKMWQRVDSRQALAAGFFVGLGFALVESLLHLSEVSARGDAQTALVVAFLRLQTALPLHAGLGAVCGCYLAARAYARAWLIPVLLHGLYDAAIFEAAGGGGPVLLALGYLVLALMVWWVVRLYVWTASVGSAQDSGRFSPL